MKRAIFLLLLTSCARNEYPIPDIPSYTKDLRPIFVNRCLQCHNLSNKGNNWLIYQDAYTKRDQIKDRVSVKRNIPPGPIPERERKMVRRWVDTGGQR